MAGVIRLTSGRIPYVRKALQPRCGGASYNQSVRVIRTVTPYLVTIPIVAACVAIFSVPSVTVGAVAPALLLSVVVVARLWGLGPALFAASLAAASLSYFFLPPPGFGIEDRDDWIAFATFLVTAVIAGELASRAERRAAEAQQGRIEIERLYQELQAAFDRASEAEAARRNEQLKAPLL